MGTNYYLHTPPCPHCGKADPPIHIGKSSGGWCFALCYNEAHFLVSLEDWKLFLKHSLENGYRIEDEYGERISYDTLIDAITNRRSLVTLQENVEAHNRFYAERRTVDVEEFLRRNHAEIGPNNLLRHRLGDSCVAHGEGTWDMVAGEFS